MRVKNLITRSITSAFVFLTGCGGAMNETEFDWHATESGPEHYPMEIRQGTFFYKGMGRGLYIPNGATLNGGWGEMRSTHVTGPKKKPLPDRMEIIYFSYAEKQFYHGVFDLPYGEILRLFRESTEANKATPDDLPDYNGIMVGVAPGGAVSVWLKGGLITEVFFGQAEKVDIDPSNGFALPFESELESNAYFEKQLVNSLSLEELESLKKNGIPFGTWARYRKFYKWVPTYRDGKIPYDKEMYASYLNGERYRMSPILTDEQENTFRPLPRELKFSVMMGDADVSYVIRFEEFELMDAFEKLGANGEKVYLEFDPQPRYNTKVRVRNDKETIELKKIVTEDW